jgi:type IV pilus assembly protein PilM
MRLPLKRLVDRLTTTALVGVDLGSAAIKVVELDQREGGIRLRRAGVAAAGEHPAQALRQLLQDAGISVAHAALALASPEAIVKPFRLPAMPRKELAGALQLEAEQAVLSGRASHDTAVDWYLFNTAPKEPAGLLAVAPRPVMETRLGIARAAGLQPIVMDVEPLALWNAYWALVGSWQSAPKTVLLLNVGARTTNLVIAKGPEALCLVRNLELGGPALEDGQRLEWLSEIRDSIGYARSNGGLRALDEVYVTGGGSGAHLLPLLEPVVGAAVTLWNPLDQIALGREERVPYAQGPLFAVAIGLALRQPQ